MSRPSIGFVSQNHASDGMEAIKRMFTPEFRNRVDAIIQFQSLDRENVSRVVDKFLIELETQLNEKGVALEVSAPARAWLAEHGFDEKMGARPMARVIQEHIKRPLAEELLFGCLVQGGSVLVDAEDSKLKFEIEGKKQPVHE